MTVDSCEVLTGATLFERRLLVLGPTANLSGILYPSEHQNKDYHGLISRLCHKSIDDLVVNIARVSWVKTVNCFGQQHFLMPRRSYDS